MADPNAIFTISAGANDIQDVVSGAQGVSDLQASAGAYGDMAQQLVNAGANSVLILNAPDVGKAPIAAGNEFAASFLTAVSNGLIG